MKYIKNHSTNVVLQVMICARTATIVSADDINDFDTLEEEDQEKLRAMVKEINETRGDKALKKAWKASVAHLKPQKKKKKTAAAEPKKRKAETDPDPMLSVEEEIKCTAKEAMGTLLDACRKMNAPLPQDDVQAKQRLSGYLLSASPEGRSSGVWRLRDAFREVLKELGVSTKKQKTESSVQAAVAANQKLVDAFYEMSKGLMKTNRFKGIARKKAADAIVELDFEVTDGIPLSKGKTKVAGIGKGTAKDINEILETGTCGTLEDIRAG